ncbi:AAA domain protein, partial [Brucella grignonensis]
RRRRHGDLR